MDFLDHLQDSIDRADDAIWELALTIGIKRNRESAERLQGISSHIIQEWAEIYHPEVLQSATGLTPKIDNYSNSEKLIASAVIQISIAEKELTKSNEVTIELIQAIEFMWEVIGIIREALRNKSPASAVIANMARRGAAARHSENRDMKAQALAWYSDNKDRFKSKNAAAEEIIKLVPVKFRTARAWLDNI